MSLMDECVLKIVEFLKEEINPYLIIVFGSYAKGVSRKDSDIDIAYANDKSLSSYENFMIAQKLAGILGIEIDLIELHRASTVMKAQIVSSGKIVYCTDEIRRMNFYVKVLKEYALLNEERAVILRDIERRGSIYEQ
jgi:predicted nucleotidyltransferase